MRTTLAAFTAAISIAAVALLAGCSGGSQGPTTLVPTSGMAQTQSRSIPSTTALRPPPQFVTALRFGSARSSASASRVHPNLVNLTNHLFVGDPGTNAVEILNNGSYSFVGAITNKVDDPQGTSVDLANDLYVANLANGTIEEYGRGTTAPSFTYSDGMTAPLGVTADAAFNVYDGDFIGGVVNEYAQASNKVLASCSPGSLIEGVAVDKNGDVFVDYDRSPGFIAEYKGGLSGCHKTVLGVTLAFPGSMALDNAQNLIVCDQTGPTVDVIAKPYTSVTRTLGSGYSDPFHVAINLSNKLVFVTDVGNANVQVLNYPSGTLVTTLGSSNGLVLPYSAVDAPNAVY